MACYHEGHDGDCSHEVECVICHEVIYDATNHHCIILTKEQP